MTEIIVFIGVAGSALITHIMCNKIIDFIGETNEDSSRINRYLNEPRRPSKR